MNFTSNIHLDHRTLQVEVTVLDYTGKVEYAYYLYEKKRGLLVKHMYTSDNIYSFQLTESGTYYIRTFVRWKEAGSFKYSILSQNTDELSFRYYNIKTVPYEALEQESFQSQEGTLYDILWDGVHYEVYIRNHPTSPNAIILGSGAVGRRIKPNMHRFSWAPELPGTAIYYNDPTSYIDSCKLGWGYGTNQRWSLEDIAILLCRILRKLNIKPENTLFYGSSGGGFTSMLLAAMFHSRATVINPQFIVENYKALAVKILKQVCLKEGEQLIPQRTHVVDFFQAVGYFPLLHIVQNLCSEGDVLSQVTPFLSDLAKSGLMVDNRFWFEFYTKEGGHNAMPDKSVCLKHILEDLALPIVSAPYEVHAADAGFLSRFLSELHKSK